MRMKQDRLLAGGAAPERRPIAIRATRKSRSVEISDTIHHQSARRAGPGPYDLQDPRIHFLSNYRFL